MPDIDAVSDAGTGAVLGRTVEPGRGIASDDGHTHETACLNCGAALVGDFCHQCGQKAHVHRTLGGFFHDLLHGVLHVEGKIWNTLPLLVGKPGQLTRRYIDGERARFVSPVALFLFSVFLLFAIASVTGASTAPEVAEAEISRDFTRAIARTEAKIAVAEAERTRAMSAGASTEASDERLSELRTELAALRAMRDGKPGEAVSAQLDRSAPQWLRSAIAKAASNPDLLFYKLKTNAYKLSWALIPLSVPFLWLLFPFSRRFRLYDHTVFVTYSLCFMTLLVVAALLLGAVGLGTIASFAVLVPPLHMYSQLKGTYSLTIWGALWRTLLLVAFAFAAISLFGLLLVALGLTG